MSLTVPQHLGTLQQVVNIFADDVKENFFLKNESIGKQRRFVKNVKKSEINCEYSRIKSTINIESIKYRKTFELLVENSNFD